MNTDGSDEHGRHADNNRLKCTWCCPDWIASYPHENRGFSYPRSPTRGISYPITLCVKPHHARRMANLCASVRSVGALKPHPHGIRVHPCHPCSESTHRYQIFTDGLAHLFLSHAEGKRLRGHQCMRGGLKAQLHRTAQGKRSGTLGSHCAPANQHSRPARAGSTGKHHQSPIRTPTTCCVIHRLTHTRQLILATYFRCTRACRQSTCCSDKHKKRRQDKTFLQKSRPASFFVPTKCPFQFSLD